MHSLSRARSTSVSGRVLWEIRRSVSATNTLSWRLHGHSTNGRLEERIGSLRRWNRVEYAVQIEAQDLVRIGSAGEFPPREENTSLGREIRSMANKR
ncbi:hypothetical protein BDV28DRAFT_136165 [Aspergillus coremiiformis]|uniref:Uncharacterized protein n=1 Tax=Aspergillus coremiiformis TaxID=138285 RepID=A0A5N6Z2L7_9EURO|nr:hypothetical protein BDV28DRAFT_136165 [Aspergillus coremiiformis]